MARNHEGTLDAIGVLKSDHRAIEQLFRHFERARGAAEKKRLADRIVRELSIHAAVEEQHVYPLLRRRLNGQIPRVLVGLEQHHVAKLALVEIEALGPEDERFEPKVRVLMESVRGHIAEEERDLLSAMRHAVSPEELRSLGEALVHAKNAAPTRPHPAAPDHPPGNLIANAGAAAMDRSREAIGRGIARVLDRSWGVVEHALRRGEVAARHARERFGRGLERNARQRMARGLERAAREIRPDAH